MSRRPASVIMVDRRRRNAANNLAVEADRVLKRTQQSEPRRGVRRTRLRPGDNSGVMVVNYEPVLSGYHLIHDIVRTPDLSSQQKAEQINEVLKGLNLYPNNNTKRLERALRLVRTFDSYQHGIVRNVMEGGDINQAVIPYVAAFALPDEAPEFRIVHEIQRNLSNAERAQIRNVLFELRQGGYQPRTYTLPADSPGARLLRELMALNIIEGEERAVDEPPAQAPALAGPENGPPRSADRRTRSSSVREGRRAIGLVDERNLQQVSRRGSLVNPGSQANTPAAPRSASRGSVSRISYLNDQRDLGYVYNRAILPFAGDLILNDVPREAAADDVPREAAPVEPQVDVPDNVSQEAAPDEEPNDAAPTPTFQTVAREYSVTPAMLASTLEKFSSDVSARATKINDLTHSLDSGLQNYAHELGDEINAQVQNALSAINNFVEDIGANLETYKNEHGLAFSNLVARVDSLDEAIKKNVTRESLTNQLAELREQLFSVQRPKTHGGSARTGLDPPSGSSGSGSSSSSSDASLPGLPRGAGNGGPPHKGGGKGDNGIADPSSSRQEIAKDDPEGMVSATRAEEKLGQLFPQISIDNSDLRRYFTTKLAYVWRSTGDEQQVRDVLTGAARVGNFNDGKIDPTYNTPGEVRSFLRDMKLTDAEVYARHRDSLKDMKTAHHVLLAKAAVYGKTIDNELKNVEMLIKHELGKDISSSEILKRLKGGLENVRYSPINTLREFYDSEKLKNDAGEFSEQEQAVYDLVKKYLGFNNDKMSLNKQTNKLRGNLARYSNEENNLMRVVREAGIDLDHPAKQVESLKKNVSDILDAIHTKKKDAEEEKKVLKQELASHRADVERLVRSLWVKEPIERIAAVNARIQKTVSGGNRTREVAVPRPRAPKEPVRKKTVKKAKKEVVTPVTDADAVWKKIMQNQRWKG